jgi:hypothetical protein
MAQPIPLGADKLRRLREVFHELKAEQDPLLRQQQARTFVHTQVYREVKEEGRSLLVGRKGAGKTALLVGYRAEHEDDYLAQADIEIVADEFPLEPLFNFFYRHVRDKVEKTDLGDFLDPTRVATYAWKHSLVSSALFMAASSLLDDPDINPRLTATERRNLEDACEQVLRLYDAKAQRGSVRNGGSLLASLLVYNVGSFPDIIQTVLDSNGPGNIAGTIAQITSKLSGLLKKETTEELRKPIMQVRQILDRFGKKVLLTLDRFDDFYDEFLYRQDTGEQTGIEKREFLASLLKGLVIAARDLQRAPRDYGWLHMIFTIPADKFIELNLRERADMESNHVVRLGWTPTELFEMVNRRIAYALELNLPGDELNAAWRTVFPFDVGNGRVRKVREDSFLYLVRHSLWNPRELQMYLKAIFAEMERTGRAADEEMFRSVVSRETERIIKGEFIGQFIGEYNGLNRMLNKLGNVRLQTVMQYEELCDKLSGVELFEGCRTSDQTMLRLFHMGVVGVRANARRDVANHQVITQERQDVTYRYCFNCDEADPFATTCEVCFHPMFFEYLNLEHQKPYVVNQLAWEMFDR